MEKKERSESVGDESLRDGCEFLEGGVSKPDEEEGRFTSAGAHREQRRRFDVENTSLPYDATTATSTYCRKYVATRQRDPSDVDISSEVDQTLLMVLN